MELIDLLVSGEAEVCYFQSKVFIDEDVLELEISVNDSFVLNVPENIKHLGHKVPSSFFAHTSNSLAQVEEETARDVFEQNVDEVLDFSSRWLEHVAIRSVPDDVDDVSMVEALEDLDLLLDRLDAVSISLQKFFSQQFEGKLLLWLLERANQVDLRGVTLSKRAEDFILTYEYWVFHLVSLLGWRFESLELILSFHCEF